MELYVKRLARPMITMEIQDISRLAGHICIPSMVKSAIPKDTILQKIMYSSLRNQCRKCRQFGHFAYAYIVSKVPIWDGSTPVGKLPTWSKRVARGFDSMPSSKTISTIKNVGKNHEIGSKNHKKTMNTNIFVVEAKGGHVLQLLSENPTTKKVKKIPTLEQWKQKALISNEVDQKMGEPKEFLIHSSTENLVMVQPGDKD